MQDSDYLNLCGDNSRICSGTPAGTLSQNPFEATEGGTPKGGIIIGTLDPILDPQIIVVDLIDVPGEPATGGFIGNDLPPAFLVPEPASWTVLIIGLGSSPRYVSLAGYPAPRADLTLRAASSERRHR